MIGSIEASRGATRDDPIVPWAVLAACCVALAIRSIAPISIVATALVGAVGVIGLRSADVLPAKGERARWIGVVIAGSALFAASLAFGDAAIPARTWVAVTAVSVAAIDEEAFFRGAMFTRLAHRGPVIAIGVTSLLFGLIHVPVYGFSILPLDIAAGAVLGWQRHATGSWSAPAATHLAANLVVFL